MLAPGGVLALETKWRTRELDRRWRGRDLAQAPRNAAKTRSLLRSKNVADEVHDVTPVLVIWGKASRDVASGGECLDGAHVVDGKDLTAWLARYDRGRVAQDNAERTLKALRSFSLESAPS